MLLAYSSSYGKWELLGIRSKMEILFAFFINPTNFPYYFIKNIVITDQNILGSLANCPSSMDI